MSYGNSAAPLEELPDCFQTGCATLHSHQEAALLMNTHYGILSYLLPGCFGGNVGKDGKENVRREQQDRGTEGKGAP